MSYFGVQWLKKLKLYALPPKTFLCRYKLILFRTGVFIQFVLYCKHISVENGFYLRRHLVQKSLKN